MARLLEKAEKLQQGALEDFSLNLQKGRQGDGELLSGVLDAYHRDEIALKSTLSRYERLLAQSVALAHDGAEDAASRTERGILTSQLSLAEESGSFECPQRPQPTTEDCV